MRAYTGKERVEAAFRGEYADRVPLFTSLLENAACAALAGYTLRECYVDPAKGLELLIKAQELFPSDGVFVPGDPLLPTAIAARQEARGGKEAVGERLLAEKETLKTVRVRDPRQSSTYGPYLAMCRRVKELFKDTWVVALVPGVWSSAVEMRGPEQIIYDTQDDPTFVHTLMEFSLAYAKERGMAVAETGVNVVFGDPSASCSLISPKIYREFVKPYHAELFRYLQEKVKGEVKIGLHICGYIDPIGEDLASLPIDWLEMDAPSSLAKMISLSQRRFVVRGNVSGNILLAGTKAEIEAAVAECIKVGAPGSKYILAPGCVMPQNAPLENIKYFWEAAQKYGQYVPSQGEA